MSDELGEVDYLNRHVQTGATGLQQKIEELVGLSHGRSDHSSLYNKMLTAVVRMAQSGRNRWDAKIMLQTIREMEQAFARLETFKRRRKVTVFGSARTPVSHDLYVLAKEMGATLARHEFMTITGAGAGIMAAAHEGAGLDYSLGFNITLPFEQRSNDIVHDTDHDLSFKFFFLRKLFFVKEAEALILCPGGFGTLDETLEVITLIQTGKSPVVPVILLDVPGGRYWSSLMEFFKHQLCDNAYIVETDLNLVTLVSSPAEAMQNILDFYSNYHSARWNDGQYVMRLNRPLTDRALQHINQTFARICLEPGFTQATGPADQSDEPELQELARLSFVFNGRDHGTLRKLIDFVNQPENQQIRDTA
ncbi:MAG TPA: TIGR00730 family Rossman fold protein [Pseudomonas xinjiangensis]|uniref:AMP nucleosidase n=2 Tax=root TaxID=1 RepID=A0A7V1BPD1_9GAMM|nr:TIGR00730 family Rossman fold protein [Halopseudomonas xinjiangensis]HEC47947.1 TIGR00730 family Rossman fold protein [Halopseudomonas xinjiangensis]